MGARGEGCAVGVQSFLSRGVRGVRPWPRGCGARGGVWVRGGTGSVCGCAGCVQSSLSGCAVGEEGARGGVWARAARGARVRGRCAQCVVCEGGAGARGVQWARSGCAREVCAVCGVCSPPSAGCVRRSMGAQGVRGCEGRAVGEEGVVCARGARWDGECVRGARWVCSPPSAGCGVCGGCGGAVLPQRVGEGGVCSVQWAVGVQSSLSGCAVGAVGEARWARGVQSSLSGVCAEEYGGAGCAGV